MLQLFGFILIPNIDANLKYIFNVMYPLPIFIILIRNQ